MNEWNVFHWQTAIICQLLWKSFLSIGWLSAIWRVKIWELNARKVFVLEKQDLSAEAIW